MTPMLGLLLIVVIAFVGKMWIMPHVKHEHPIIAGIAVSGIPYVLLGIVLGPIGFEFLNRDILTRLEPFLSLALGWVGMLFGIQLRWRNIRRFPTNYLVFTSSQSLVSFFLIAAICGIGFPLLSPGLPINMLIFIALFLAAVGAISSPITIGRAMITHKARGKLTHLLQFATGLDSFWGITIAGLLFAFFPQTHPSSLSAVMWIFLYFGIGSSIGFLLLFLLQIGFEQEELLLLTLGIVFFNSGIGFVTGLSPIFLNMITGIVLAQSRIHASRLMNVLTYAEKPIYLMLLVFAGALWYPPVLSAWSLIFLFLASRWLSKWSGGLLATRFASFPFSIPPKVGNMLLSFGGVSLALAFNFTLAVRGEAGNIVLSAALAGIILFDELAMWSTVQTLRQAQEIPDTTS